MVSEIHSLHYSLLQLVDLDMVYFELGVGLWEICTILYRFSGSISDRSEHDDLTQHSRPD